MKKIKDNLINFIVDKKYYILVLFTLISLFSLFLSTKVNINYDMSNYLPKDSETRIGKNLMEENFSGMEESSLNLMFKDLDSDKKSEIKDELSKINGIKEVAYDETDDYNKDNFTLYVLTIDAKEDSEIAKKVYEEVSDKYSNYEISTSGSVSDWNKPVLHLWIIVLAIASAMLILIVMCESLIEPFLFLYAIGLAVFVNMGSNIMFSSVSNITSSISAILQLALSMDYSIMLMNRYSQEREHEKNKNKAMKTALKHATSSIASSSVTTIVGLLALVFMSFTIGRDLGFVLAKGVLLSLISIFLVLPALILLFDGLILKTKKKSLNIKMTKIGEFVYKLRYPITIVFVVIFSSSFVLKGGVNILYTGSENDEVASVFDENNQIAIVYDSSKEEMVSNVIKNIDDDKVTNILAYGNTIGEKLKYTDVNSKLESLGLDAEVEEYLLKLVYYNYYNKDNNIKMTINDFVNFVNKEIISNEYSTKNIDNDVKSNMKKLTKFSDKKQINKKRSSKEIADILGVEEEIVKDVFILYNSKSINTKMRIDELVDFINSNVLKNPKYSSMISKEDKESLNKLSVFVNKSIINKEMTSSELSKILNIPKNSIDNLILLYYMNNNNDIKLSLKDILDGVKYLSVNTKYLEGMEIDALLNLEVFIENKDNINNRKLDKNSLKYVFNEINRDLVDFIYLTFNLDDDTLFSPYEFINFVITNVGSNMAPETLRDITMLKLVMESSSNNTLYSASEVSKILNIPQEKTNSLYTLIAKTNGYEFKLSPFNLVKLIMKNDEVISSLDSNSIKTLKLVDTVMESVNNGKMYSANEISNILGIKQDNVKLIYSLASNKNIKLSLNEFVNYILSDVVSNKNYKNYFDSNVKKKLEAIEKVMSSSLKNEKFSAAKIYVMLSSLNEKIDEDLVELVYLYNGSVNDMDETKELTLEELVNYLNKDILSNPMYQDILSSDMKEKIRDADIKIGDAKKLLTNNGYSRVILNTTYSSEGKDTFDFISKLKNSLKEDEIYVIGDSPMALEMSNSFNDELNFITVLTMILIFVVVAITFKSLIVPAILVLIIQCAVYITMSILSLTGSNVYFISLLIVQSILMGATIDYAIVYTTYYMEMRKKGMDVKKSLIESYNNSIHTILCSSSILVIVTLIVGNFASQIAAKICMTLSKGSLCAALLILFVLPPILAIFDRFIIKK